MATTISTEDKSLEVCILPEEEGLANILKINSKRYNGIEIRLEIIDPTTDRSLIPDNAIYRLDILEVGSDGNSYSTGNFAYITSKLEIVQDYKGSKSNE